ncbi:dTDP-4-dehydrorhamnose 3,5-epimerase family protein [Tropheryma whipplei]|uniref:dTDP-4-dehydrorhamnose 3,5-epimerase family protein n=1 Tax=Tropheryma whipplei TaxID=2039 RepID=UPI0004ACABC8|nr:dTDP-4-dehydrorhamnose 3,5-epimerase [Tropheryma whipplei]
MELRNLKVNGCLEVTPEVHVDSRGSFSEVYRFDVLEKEIGYPLRVAQVNRSFSKKAVLRGLHYSLAPHSQAKYVMCANGAVLDFVFDLRLGSPSFGVWDAVLLDSVGCRAVYIPEGVGHAFIALSKTATVNYLCSATYDPEREKSINPLDKNLNLEYPFTTPEIVLSERDAAAPTLPEAQKGGFLPKWDECRWDECRATPEAHGNIR